MMNRNARTKFFYGVVIVLVIILFVMLFSIQKDDFGSESASMPINQSIPLQGVWQVKHIEYLSETESSLSLDSKFYVDKNLVALGEVFTVRPNFKAKYVNINSFLTYKYTEFPWLNEFKNRYTTVYIISDGERFYQEIIQISDDSIVLVYNSNLYLLEQISGKVSETTIKKYNDIYQTSQSLSTESKENDLAVLVGMKTKYPTEEKLSSDYRTYLIRIKKDNSMNIYLTEDLFVPRQEGFWTLSLKENLVNETNDIKEDEPKGGNPEYRILAGPFDKEQNTVRVVNTRAEINYVGPSYVAANIYKEKSKPSYSIYSLEQANSLDGISIEEIAGKNGVLALEETIASKQAELNLEDSESTKLNIANLSKNIGVRRRNGRWYFMTNLQYTVANEVKTSDVDLNIIPEIDILREPELPIKWNNVKNLSPGAIDAISSPDGRILIIQTQEELLIYDLSGSSTLIGSIPINDTDTIVMNEWAIGNYPEYWENEFRKTRRKPVHYFKE